MSVACEPAGYVAAADRNCGCSWAWHSSPGCGHFTGGALRLEPLDPSRLDIAFALVWGIGIVCAVGTAYLAKYHRLAALILMGGAGLVVCITFRLAVRTRSRPDASAGGDRDDGADPARLALAAEAP